MITGRVRAAILILLACLLSACGFALRGSANFPFNSIYVADFNSKMLVDPDAGSLVKELKRSIRYSGNTQILEDGKNADVIFEPLDERREKNILSLNAQGRVREYDLIYTYRFRVRNDAGKIFLDSSTIKLHRIMTYDETEVLAKEQEEKTLYRDMQKDLVQQIMRRLAALDFKKE